MQKKQKVGSKKVYIDKIYFCPHHPESEFKGENKNIKYCRLPILCSLSKQIKDLNIDKTKSFMLGEFSSIYLLLSQFDKIHQNWKRKFSNQLKDNL